MKNRGLPKKIKSYIPFIVCVVALTFAMPHRPRFGYEYEKGSVWKYETLISECDFPIYKTEAQMMEERLALQKRVVPYFRYSDAVVLNNLRAIDNIDFGLFSFIREDVSKYARNIYSIGIIPDDLTSSVATDKFSEEVLYVIQDKLTRKYPLSEKFKQGDARTGLLEDISAKYPGIPADSILTAAGVYAHIVPNLLYDKRTTDLARNESLNSISPTQSYVEAGVTLVSKGEMITSEIKQVLDSYAAEYSSQFGGEISVLPLWISGFLLAVLLSLIFMFVLFFTSKGTFSRSKELHYVTFIFLISSVSILLLERFNLQRFAIMLPLPVVARYLEAFFKDKVIVAVYVVSLLPLLLLEHYGAGYFLMFLLAGLVAVILSQRLKRGVEQFLVALAVFGVLLFCYKVLDFRMSIGMNLWHDVAKMLIGSFLSMALYPMIFLFERVFGLVSDSRLEELSNTGNKLLRELEIKAPGTFQHSLQVMSMCTAAARAIGADEYLIRAAAMYHDIGKMNNPLCFIENTTALSGDGPDYHDGLDPKQSAHDIIRHVADGMDMAAKYHLPRTIREFILSHHGTTVTSYFYNKFLNEGGSPDECAAFTYQGRKPITREQAILMICDTVEAASRTLKGGSPEIYSDFVERMVASKVNEEQFSDSELTIGELHAVKEALKSYLSQLYHERVVYPQQKVSTKNNSIATNNGNTEKSGR